MEATELRQQTKEIEGESYVLTALTHGKDRELNKAVNMLTTRMATYAGYMAGDNGNRDQYMAVLDELIGKLSDAQDIQQDERILAYLREDAKHKNMKLDDLPRDVYIQLLRAVEAFDIDVTDVWGQVSEKFRLKLMAKANESMTGAEAMSMYNATVIEVVRGVDIKKP